MKHGVQMTIESFGKAQLKSSERSLTLRSPPREGDISLNIHDECQPCHPCHQVEEDDNDHQLCQDSICCETLVCED